MGVTLPRRSSRSAAAQRAFGLQRATRRFPRLHRVQQVLLDAGVRTAQLGQLAAVVRRGVRQALVQALQLVLELGDAVLQRLELALELPGAQLAEARVG